MSEKIKETVRCDISAAGYKKMWDSQNGRCGICKRLPTGKGDQLAVDHAFATGKVRGLLCRECLGALVIFQDSAETIRRAVKFLKGTL